MKPPLLSHQKILVTIFHLRWQRKPVRVFTNLFFFWTSWTNWLPSCNCAIRSLSWGWWSFAKDSLFDCSILSKIFYWRVVQIFRQLLVMHTSTHYWFKTTNTETYKSTREVNPLQGAKNLLFKLSDIFYSEQPVRPNDAFFHNFSCLKAFKC